MSSNENQQTGNPNLQKQDLSQLDITTLSPLSPEVISRQATINIGTIGHVAHGKSTVVKAISGVHTVRFKNELERNITIKLDDNQNNSQQQIKTNKTIASLTPSPTPSTTSSLSSLSIATVNSKKSNKYFENILPNNNVDDDDDDDDDNNKIIEKQLHSNNKRKIIDINNADDDDDDHSNKIIEKQLHGNIKRKFIDIDDGVDDDDDSNKIIEKQLHANKKRKFTDIDDGVDDDDDSNKIIEKQLHANKKRKFTDIDDGDDIDESFDFTEDDSGINGSIDGGSEDVNDTTTNKSNKKQLKINYFFKKQSKNIILLPQIEKCTDENNIIPFSYVEEINRLNEIKLFLSNSTTTTTMTTATTTTTTTTDAMHQQLKAKKTKIVEYVVEHIEDIYEIDDEPHFHVKWKGYPKSQNTYEPLKNVYDCRSFEKFINAALESNKILINELVANILNKENIIINNSNSNNKLKDKQFLINFNLNQLNSDLILLVNLDIYDRIKKEDVIMKRIIENLKLFQYYKLGQEQLFKIATWANEINEIDKSKNLFVENLVDFEIPLQNFKYTNDVIPMDGIIIPDDPPIGCECTTGCSVKSKCCGSTAGSQFAYTVTRRIKVSPGTPIFECNKQCKCGEDCSNRVVQQGRKHTLCIFKTLNERGWGVRTERTIYSGQYICEYVGEIITYEEAELRGQKYDAEGRTYLFDLDFNSNDNPYSIDAARYGNVSRFINHSCDPNCGVWSVWINCLDLDLPKLCLFALRRIESGEELTFDYKNPNNNGSGSVFRNDTSIQQQQQQQQQQQSHNNNYNNDNNDNSNIDSDTISTVNSNNSITRKKSVMICKCGTKKCRQFVF